MNFVNLCSLVVHRGCQVKQLGLLTGVSHDEKRAGVEDVEEVEAGGEVDGTKLTQITSLYLKKHLGKFTELGHVRNTGNQIEKE